MTFSSIGDLARSFQMTRQTGQAKEVLTRLTNEVASGRADDAGRHLGGDFTEVAGIERGLSLLGSYRTATAEASTRLSAMQSVIGHARSVGDDQGSKLLKLGDLGLPSQIDAAGREARAQFDALVNTLNTRNGGRSLLAGAQSDGPALAPPGTIMSALSAATAGETTAEGVRAAVEAWFLDPGGGFEGAGYLGGEPAAALRVSQQETVQIDVTAADPALRRTLAGLATGALLAEGALEGDAAGRAGLATEAGAMLAAGGPALGALEGHVGAAEARVESAAARNSAEATAMESARNDLVGRDPFETASALEETTARLEKIYTVTARLSRLSLLEFLR